MSTLKESLSYKYDNQDNLKIKKILKNHKNKAVTKISCLKNDEYLNNIARN